MKFAPSPQDKEHVARKPLYVMVWLLAIDSGLVVDPFVENRTMILTASKLSQPCYAADTSPVVAAVCLERLAEVGEAAAREEVATRRPRFIVIEWFEC